MNFCILMFELKQNYKTLIWGLQGSNADSEPCFMENLFEKETNEDFFMKHLIEKTVLRLLGGSAAH